MHLSFDSPEIQTMRAIFLGLILTRFQPGESSAACFPKPLNGLLKGPLTSKETVETVPSPAKEASFFTG
jgi:hypothetical protein